MAVIKLNKHQFEAVNYIEGPLLILAGAGSGKTRVITQKIAFLINKKNVSPLNILAVTFTNKAAKEMMQRVAGLCNGSKPKGLIISTFHSLCVRILRNNIQHLEYANNFAIFDEEDSIALVKQICVSHKLDEKLAKVYLASISRVKENLMLPLDYERSSKVDPEVLLIYKDYQYNLKAQNALDFNDIILLTVILLRNFTDIKERYAKRFKYIMVDEFQDTSPMQYELIRYLASVHKNISVVGDDDQSIYSWRGADLTLMKQFEIDYKPVKVVKLEQNYRTTNIILNAANAVISNNVERHQKRLWSQLGDGEKIIYNEYDDEYLEAKGITEHIINGKFIKNKKYKDFAILCRTNFQFKTIEKALREKNIPYRVIGGYSFFDRKEVKDIVAYLRILENPENEIALLRIINFPKRGIGPTALALLREFASKEKISIFDAMSKADDIPNLNPKLAQNIHEFWHLINEEMEKFKSAKFLFDGAKHYIQEIGYTDALRQSLSGSSSDKEKRKDVERRINTVNEFLEIIKSYESDPEQYLDDSGEGKPSLRGFLERVNLIQFDKDEEDEINKDDKVTLLTAHSAKGLEFPSVVIAGFEQGLFPHGNNENRDEERRLCYVAITRAQRSLYITGAQNRMRWGNSQKQEPSSFLEEIPENCIIISAQDNEPKSEEQEKQGMDNLFAALKKITKS